MPITASQIEKIDNEFEIGLVKGFNWNMYWRGLSHHQNHTEVLLRPI